MSSEEYVVALADYLKAGIPVLVVDYALQQANADHAYVQHDKFHLVGLVTMRSLEDLTDTPPPAIANCGVEDKWGTGRGRECADGP